MSFNPGYAWQQLLVAALSLAFALPVSLLLRAAWPRGRAPWLRSWLELASGCAVLAIAGMGCLHLGYGHLLPGTVLPWAVAVGLEFYWLAVWWPALVALRWRALRQSASGRLVMLGALVMVVGALYSTVLEPRWLEVERRDLVLRDAGSRPLRLAHISDLQLIALGGREEELVRAVNAFEPHLIVMTGDYIAMSTREDVTIPAARSVLSRLRASHGIFLTSGDSDSERQRQEIFRGLDVHYLLNRSMTVEIEGVPVRIGGLNHTMPRWERTAGDVRDDELFIMACHWPDHAERTTALLPTTDLFLCGHTHGGQVQIPFFGPPVTFSDVDRRIAAGGIFATTNRTPWVLSRGVGMEGGYAPRFRFRCRPHVFLLSLRGTPAPGR